MGRSDPFFDQSTELLRPLEKFCCFCRCGNLDTGVVDHIPLASAGVEKQDEFVGRLSKREAGTLKAERVVVPWDGSYPITGTRNRHTGGLQGCVVGGSKATIFREGWQRRVSEVPLDNGAEFIEFLFARLVRVYFAPREQLLPAHLRSPPTLSSCCA